MRTQLFLALRILNFSLHQTPIVQHRSFRLRVCSGGSGVNVPTTASMNTGGNVLGKRVNRFRGSWLQGDYWVGFSYSGSPLVSLLSSHKTIYNGFDDRLRLIKNERTSFSRLLSGGGIIGESRGSYISANGSSFVTKTRAKTGKWLFSGLWGVYGV
jgi:hypothetical protein